MSYIKDFEKTYTPDTQKNQTQKGTHKGCLLLLASVTDLDADFII